LKKKKLTNKELTDSITGLSQNDEILWKEILDVKQVFGLYLEYRKESYKEDNEGFNNFVKAKIEEFERQQRSKIKK
jgi:hypothetical protein|tara:strand:+ start:59 stop:286 length:228 start_codon:yes stop_codon:yes gene_type:complete